jgi:hypothetical protein
MDFRHFIHALILIPAQIKTGGRRLTFRILSYNRWVRLILDGSQRLRRSSSCVRHTYAQEEPIDRPDDEPRGDLFVKPGSATPSAA